MLGALGVVAGIDAKAVQAQVIAALENVHHPVHAFIANFLPTFSVGAILYCVKNLKKEYASPEADAVLSVASVVLGIGVTVIQGDGTVIPVNGGGRILLRVQNPQAHYHATDPA
jgi:hypothetical protein